jgi:hypothetical protein
MKFLDRLTERFQRRQSTPEPDPIQERADFTFPNRATRRKMGLRFPIGLLTGEHVGLVVQDEPYLPRYVRRHFTQGLGDQTKRRNRKARSRIALAMAPIAPKGATKWS